MDTLLQVVIFLGLWAALLILVVFWLAVILMIIGTVLGWIEKRRSTKDRDPTSKVFGLE